jgi:CRISPR-associated DxTHG motif protein
MIISILGTSGAKINLETCLPSSDTQSALYDISLFEKENKEGTYINSTHFLIENFDGKFVFIGTACAIKFQKKVLENELHGKDYSFIEISENDLDDIFEAIYELLEHQENILLDITHGFRHQPIMAIFASTLSQFLDRKSLKIIFAKEEERFKRYKYVYLDDYIEITQLSLQLSGFIKTLNFIPIENMKLINNEVFENFSKSLLSNDLKGVEKNYTLLNNELNYILEKGELKHLFKMIYKIKEELNSFEKFDNNSSTHYKYLSLGKVTIDRNYIIVSLAYIFESFREYCTYNFKPILKDIKLKKGYETNTAIMDTICNFERNGKKNAIQKRYPQIYQQNKQKFQRIKTIYDEVRMLRNDLAHINLKKDFEDIKKQLEQIIFKIETVYKEDILKHINMQERVIS